MLGDYVPLVIFVALTAIVVGALIGASFILGPKKPSFRKYQPYESGIVPQTSARQRLSIRFYLTAMLFIIFDVESIFFYPWAVMLHQLKWFGLIEMFVFIGILMIALAYIWRKGALEWD